MIDDVTDPVPDPDMDPVLEEEVSAEPNRVDNTTWNLLFGGSMLILWGLARIP